MGSPGWAADAIFVDAEGRKANEARLDALIAEWTADKTYVEAMHLLQAEGVAATPSFKAQDLFSDPHMLQRGALQEVDHPVLGRRHTITSPYLMSETPTRIRGSAPRLGEDNDYVLGKLLGLSKDEIERLAEAKVVH
jgi:crotonobetainyl-CoA:carnitine CoA-transferase CaiB-like acyl-CoA transferase